MISPRKSEFLYSENFPLAGYNHPQTTKHNQNLNIMQNFISADSQGQQTSNLRNNSNAKSQAGVLVPVDGTLNKSQSRAASRSNYQTQNNQQQLVFQNHNPSASQNYPQGMMAPLLNQGPLGQTQQRNHSRQQSRQNINFQGSNQG